MRGRRLPLSLARRLATEFSYATHRVPRATLSARLALRPLVAARNLAPVRSPWSAIFVRAFALTTIELPVLRRVYTQLPTPGLYELPASTACVVIEREWQGEPALFFCRIKNPATLSLTEIAARIRRAKTAPIESIKDYRRALAIARLPWPLRRLLFWLGLNLGRQVPNSYGTFGVSVLGRSALPLPRLWHPGRAS